jgi:hypothetical protein
MNLKVLVSPFIVIIILSLTLGGLYELRYHPMMGVRLFKINKRVVFFNPFRNREPEHAVEKWLRPGLTAKWDALLLSSSLIDKSTWLCGSPTTRLKSWNLTFLDYIGDSDDPDKFAALQYDLICSDGSTRSVYVELTKQTEGWKVMLFNPMPRQN